MTLFLMARPKIALLTNRPYIDAHYCFRNAVEELLAAGWDVDLYMMHSSNHPLPKFDSRGTRIFFTPSSKRETVFFLLKLLLLPDRCYHAIIATPQWGLFWGAHAARWRRTPLICLSDEVYPWNERQTPSMKKWKARETWAHQRCAFTIALSEKRFELCRLENCLPKDHRFFVVPNAPSGPPQRLKSDYLRKKLKIPDEKKILLHCGGGSWHLLRALVSNPNLIGENHVLVVHGRYEGSLDGLMESDRVKLSRQVVPSNMMDQLISSADIGLALYSQDCAEEIRNGPTAAKLGAYLKNELPIIGGNLESLRWIERKKCGAWISKLEDLSGAAKKVVENYNLHAANAARVFERDFEFTKHFSRVLKALQPPHDSVRKVELKESA